MRDSALALPARAAGMRIGLYGGSFDPPHPGHRHVALTALRRLRLDRIWWIVVPPNPLKARDPGLGGAARAAAIRRLIRHPRMDVIDGSALGSVYTVDMLRALLARGRGLRFVWVMGADSLAGFHRWRHWRELARLAPLAVVDRPGHTVRAPLSPAARALRRARRREDAAPTLAGARPPAWLFLHGPRSDLSSTAVRSRAAASNPDVEKRAAPTLS